MQPLSDKSLIDCLSTYYGIKITTLTPLNLGMDTNAWIYKAETHNHLAYFIKLKRGHQHDFSLAISELLHAAGIQAIIPPVQTMHQRSSCQIADFTLIVYPFIMGQNGFNCALTNAQWQTLGRTLRQVHDIAVPSNLKQQLRQESYSTKYRKMVRMLLAEIATPLSSDETTLKLQLFIKEQKELILRLVEGAEELAQKLKSEAQELVLCHSDIHGGNVLINENGGIYIIDWDAPIMAPKERDLMFINGGVGNVWNTLQEEAQFYAGYGKTKINTSTLAYYRHERIVEDIALYAETMPATKQDNKDRSEMYAQFIAMFAPNGVVEIALRTNANSDNGN